MIIIAKYNRAIQLLLRYYTYKYLACSVEFMVLSKDVAGKTKTRASKKKESSV